MGIGSGSAVQSSGERAIFSILKKKAKPPYCLFDVGSNEGQFLRVLLASVGPQDISVHCFEPCQRASAILTAAFGEDRRIHVNNIGIGREGGRTTLYYDRVGSGLASLTKRRLDHFGVSFDEAEEIDVTTIDAYCLENRISRIHLLKLDIEGHELDALAGAKGMLASNSVDMVTFEFGGCNIDTRTFFQDYWYFFQDRKMRLFRMTPSGYFSPIRAYRESDEQFITTNYLAMSER